jgi:hypothetical protein
MTLGWKASDVSSKGKEKGREQETFLVRVRLPGRSIQCQTMGYKPEFLRTWPEATVPLSYSRWWFSCEGDQVTENDVSAIGGIFFMIISPHLTKQLLNTRSKSPRGLTRALFQPSNMGTLRIAMVQMDPMVRKAIA